MRPLILFGLLILAVQQSVAPPVTKEKSESEDGKKDENSNYEDDGMDKVLYSRYLKEVLEVLEGDEDFRAKLQNATEEEIRSGDIAKGLDFMHHGLRTRLDEIKRNELVRLRRSATRQYEIEQGIDLDHPIGYEHLDHKNLETFEVNDLKKLIQKTTADLNEADKKRREEFKEYEMQKKFEEDEKKQKMNEEEKKKYEEQLKALQEKHKKHKPLHHPGSKQQYEEVWEKQDHMEDQKLNLKTFFRLHDLDGNGVWDPVEVDTLFIKELDKIYAQGVPDTDTRERAEERERMREHVFSEVDLNKDGLISYDEFIEQSKSSDFEKDEEWKPLNEQQIYTEEDYMQYRKHQLEEMQRRIFAPQYAGVAQHPPGQQIQYQGQLPQYQGQVPQYQHDIPQYQGYQPQVPQYQGHPAQGQMLPDNYQQVPQHAQIPQHQVAQDQIHQQVPQQGQIHQQVPQQGQIHQQAPHQGQIHQQVPQQAQNHQQVTQQVQNHQQVPQQGQGQQQVPQQGHQQQQQVQQNKNTQPSGNEIPQSPPDVAPSDKASKP
ncbi:nucleobindin-2 isoform X2 [Venturia canescens]|uniref:nucleobindin-2 isoform X2 n=1 Tax=Venturia canescens TaxID=32260 RepID=UPI001C9CE188|nr:nucleobindin-2 isoform X2 [Venturia canescens]